LASIDWKPEDLTMRTIFWPKLPVHESVVGVHCQVAIIMLNLVSLSSYQHGTRLTMGCTGHLRQTEAVAPTSMRQ